MVCAEDNETRCVINDSRPDAEQKRFSVTVRRHHTVATLYEYAKLQSSHTDFDLSLVDPSTNDLIPLQDKQEEKLSDVGIRFDSFNTLFIKPRVSDLQFLDPLEDMSSDDDLALGASASPVEPGNYNVPNPPALPSPPFETPSTDRTNGFHNRLGGGGGDTTHHNYRGLVNQAMTCYLNSLLQALYMTPEFRNALYNWEFDGENESKSIPYQLQRLFVNLQTSPKSAVETTDLTRSFGWDSAEGWQQHDIQELCRVMFDALEHKFRNTKQADLINRLYEGRMIDYVKCLECNTEKQREDKFLDIPLPVRPFGSTVANECVEEALQGFVKPEILNDTNQYFCDKCNKKCDAHKGLKFTKFPYILTLHLKRFDFDYQSFHRIKLNDKVTFPELLNLNHFVNASSDSSSSDIKLTTSTIAAAAAAAEAAAATSNGNDTGPMMMETAENFMKSDECSTTDSGSALEEDSFQNGGTSVSSTTTTPNDQFMVQDDDEGIDMELSSNGNSKSSPLNNSFSAPGPYKYELFAIMIHSGSASGGHYYAYIKDFKSSRWYSFNDQTVQPITQEDIHKSFGGGSYKTSYTGAYTSSTNAYMLMYRQIDGEKNAQPISEDQFPDHIKRLVAKIRDHEGNPSRDGLEMTRLKVAYENPHTRIVKTQRMALFNNSTLAETVQEALRMHHLKGVVPVERCRLVGYDSKTLNIERSFEDYEDKTINEVMSQLKRCDGLLLEVREEGETFEKYLPHGVMTKVYKVDPNSRDVEGPLSIRANLTQTVAEYKAVIARKLKQNPKTLLVGMTVHKDSPKLLANEEATLADEHFIDYCKVFVMVPPPATQTIADDADQYSQRFLHFIQRLDHLVALYIVLPNLEQETLDSLAIPRLSKETLASLVGADVSSTANATTNSNATATSGDSNSEDSSLSDNDRTLVEDDFGHIKLNGGGLHLANGTSGAGLVNGDTATNGNNGGSVTPTSKTNGFKCNHDDDWDVDEDGEDEDAKIMQNVQECKAQEYYFKVTHLGTGSSTGSNNVTSSNGNGTSADDCTRSTSSGDNDKHIQVLIDKRSSQAYLKYRLQSVLQISMEYFKVFSAGNLYHQNNDTANLLNEFEYKDGERLAIELGRQLRKGEYKLNVSYVNVNEMTEEMDKLPFLCTMVVKNGQTFGQVKANILAQLASTHGENHKYSHLHMNNCRLRRKGIKYPAAVYKDDERIGKDVTLTQQVEVFLQEVEDLERVTPNDVNDAVLLLRRWHPSERKLGNFQEILHTEEVELKERLSQISGIPVENIEYVRIQHSSLQCDNVLNIHGLNWISKPHYAVDDSVLFIHGTLLYYRDRTEPLKELTADERKELAKKDTTRTGSTYSPRKERALKIYLDASPKKVDD
ncbi:AGAP007106-PA-like protein [Anopheles sinensis]|uniref:Ubiquitin carboxyl-terminal hydrolase 47 n=1 Tax=Anopheles sinensis TaxID=74873 RepID=A0A084VZ55_ANOSI|nr:AGAP007106-PA-like protein [Anopheles sinensis]